MKLCVQTVEGGWVECTLKAENRKDALALNRQPCLRALVGKLQRCPYIDSVQVLERKEDDRSRGNYLALLIMPSRRPPFSHVLTQLRDCVGTFYHSRVRTIEILEALSAA